MLHYIDYDRSIYINIDASKQCGFSIIVFYIIRDPLNTEGILKLRLKVQPILFLSKTLSSVERHYWLTELELAYLV
jgi:hypothetical protein